MYNYNKALVARAREMRSEATRQERRLWYDFLSGYPVRCHRQKIIGSYIVDFFCPQAKLVIELDGAHHLQPAQLEYDAERTNYLAACGYHTIRFGNHRIDRDFTAVCDEIDREIQQRIARSNK